MLSRRHHPQTISWFRDLAQRELLELDPPYQRRSVWNQAFKDYFVDTVLLGYPVPAIYIYEDMSPDGIASYSVVDGKQRLTTILQFVRGEFTVQEASPLQNLRGKYFDDLPDEAKNDFWTYELPVEILPTTDESVLKEVFDRINRNVARLTPQELRHARFSGEFIASAEDLAEWMTDRLPDQLPRFTATSRKQMKDIELVTQLLLFAENGPRSFSQADLDEATSDRDTEWPDSQEWEADFRGAIDAVKSLAEAVEMDHNYRLRNQADFYSFYGAVLETQRDPNSEIGDAQGVMDAFTDFFARVNDDTEREQDDEVSRYYQAVRSNSNGATERRTRISIMRSLLDSDWEPSEG